MACRNCGRCNALPSRLGSARIFWTTSLLLPLAGIACHRGESPQIGVTRQEKEMAARDAGESADATGSNAARRSVALEHDFGLVRPNSTAKHRFTVENASGSNWTVKQVSRTCACTVANVSSGVINAGTSEVIEVAYRSGHGVADDRKSIHVDFAELEAPGLELVVKATVRPPLVASTKRLQFAGVGAYFRDEQFLEIENYSGEELASVGAKVDASWLSVREELRRTEDKFGRRCQVWRVHVAADATGLSPGHYQGTLTAGGKDDDAALVPVSLHVRGPVDIVPERMFFGAFDARGAAHCTVLLRFNGENAMLDPAEVKLKHDLGDWLTLKLDRRSDSLLELRGSLAMPAAAQSAKGALSLEFNDKDHTVMTIPVFATR